MYDATEAYDHCADAERCQFSATRHQQFRDRSPGRRGTPGDTGFGAPADNERIQRQVVRSSFIGISSQQQQSIHIKPALVYMGVDPHEK